MQCCEHVAIKLREERGGGSAELLFFLHPGSERIISGRELPTSSLTTDSDGPPDAGWLTPVAAARPSADIPTEVNLTVAHDPD